MSGHVTGAGGLLLQFNTTRTTTAVVSLRQDLKYR